MNVEKYRIASAAVAQLFTKGTVFGVLSDPLFHALDAMAGLGMLDTYKVADRIAKCIIYHHVNDSVFVDSCDGAPKFF